MMARSRRSQYGPPPGQFQLQIVPLLSVMFASMTPLLPIIATTPIMPPFGFMTLLGWRLLRNDIWPVWAALPLGLFDDAFSGQPMGTAMATWTAAFIVIDIIERRFVWRDHWEDWGIASVLIAMQLLAALAIARASGGNTPPYMLLPQIGFSVLLFPVVGRVCASLDRWRFAL